MFALGICLYLLFTLLVGVMTSKRVKTLDDYLVAGCNLPIYLVLPTLVATWYGAATCVGISGQVYSNGCEKVIADPFGCSLALIIAGFFFVGKFREGNFSTVGALLRSVYGRGVEVFAAWLMIPFYVGVIASEMVALGYVWHLFTGLDPCIGMYLCALVIVIYTTMGGLWAVTITDFVQLFLLVASLLMILPFCVDTAAMLPGLSNIIKYEFSTLFPQTLSASYFGKWFITGFGAMMGQEIIQRAVASRDNFTAKWGMVGAGVLYLFLGLIPILLGIVGPFLIPDLQEPELLIPMIAKFYFSPVVLLAFTVGLLSAIMSTADSFMLAGTSIVMHNLLIPTYPVKKHHLLLSRITTIGIALAALMAAVSFPRAYDLMIHSGAALFVCIFVPATAALYWRGATGRAAWCSMLMGLGVWLCYLVIFSGGAAYKQTDELLYAAAMWGGIASFVGFSLASIPVLRLSDPSYGRSS